MRLVLRAESSRSDMADKHVGGVHKQTLIPCKLAALTGSTSITAQEPLISCFLWISSLSPLFCRTSRQAIAERLIHPKKKHSKVRIQYSMVDTAFPKNSIHEASYGGLQCAQEQSEVIKMIRKRKAGIRSMITWCQWRLPSRVCLQYIPPCQVLKHLTQSQQRPGTTSMPIRQHTKLQRSSPAPLECNV